MFQFSGIASGSTWEKLQSCFDASHNCSKLSDFFFFTVFLNTRHSYVTLLVEEH